MPLPEIRTPNDIFLVTGIGWVALCASYSLNDIGDNAYSSEFMDNRAYRLYDDIHLFFVADYHDVIVFKQFR